MRLSNDQPSEQAEAAGQYATTSNLRSRLDIHEGFSTNPMGWFRWLGAQISCSSGDRVLEL
jgi:hypothetical protein